MVYQRERFPLAGHGAADRGVQLSAVSFSSLLRGRTELAAGGVSAGRLPDRPCFSSSSLRIADEFKDFEDDARYRPYRPVPRGLVTLRGAGVGRVAPRRSASLALCAGASVALSLARLGVPRADDRSSSRRGWLKRRPIVYMPSHMVIVPLVDLYATACDGGSPAFGSRRPGCTGFSSSATSMGW